MSIGSGIPTYAAVVSIPAAKKQVQQHKIKQNNTHTHNSSKKIATWFNTTNIITQICPHMHNHHHQQQRHQHEQQPNHQNSTPQTAITESHQHQEGSSTDNGSQPKLDIMSILLNSPAARQNKLMKVAHHTQPILSSSNFATVTSNNQLSDNMGDSASSSTITSTFHPEKQSRTTMNPKNEKKRRRSGSACAECRKSHKRCSSERPCTRCKNMKIACIDGSNVAAIAFASINGSVQSDGTKMDYLQRKRGRPTKRKQQPQEQQQQQHTSHYHIHFYC